MRKPPLTVAEVAEEHEVSVRTVHRMIEAKELHAVKLRGRTGAYLIRREDADAAFQARKAAS